MMDGGRSPWIVRMIEANLGGILAALFAGFAAYLIGTTTTGHRLGEVEKDVAKLQGQMETLMPRIDRMEVAAQMEREARMKGDKE